MQSNPYRDMKFILLYHDHFTKFFILQSLHRKKGSGIQYFGTFAAPNIFGPRNVPGRSANRSIYFVIQKELKRKRIQKEKVSTTVK